MFDLYRRLGSQVTGDHERGPTRSTLTEAVETADDDRTHGILIAIGLPAR
jgi:hypothetical protein